MAQNGAIRNGQEALEIGDYSGAKRIFETVLLTDPANAEANIGRLLASKKVGSIDELGLSDELLSGDPLYQSALQYADRAQRDRLIECNELIQRRINRQTMRSQIDSERQARRKRMEEDDYRNAVKLKKTVGRVKFLIFVLIAFCVIRFGIIPGQQKKQYTKAANETIRMARNNYRADVENNVNKYREKKVYINVLSESIPDLLDNGYYSAARMIQEMIGDNWEELDNLNRKIAELEYNEIISADLYQTVTFGSRDGEDLKWYVVGKNDAAAVLLAQDYLSSDMMQMIGDEEDPNTITWANCRLRDEFQWIIMTNQWFNLYESDKLRLTHTTSYQCSDDGIPNYTIDDMQDYLFVFNSDETRQYLEEASYDIIGYDAGWLRDKGPSGSFLISDGDWIGDPGYSDYWAYVRPAIKINF